MQPQSNCQGFRKLILSPRNIGAIVDGHNGLRNRVAIQHSASNMNLLHWDYDLQRMAEGWINQCIIDVDTCDFICKLICIHLVCPAVQFELFCFFIK